jgi:Trypsin/Tachylectin
VLTLEAPLPSAYTPVTLTAEGDETPYAAGTSATIVGYGETTAEDSATAGTLYQATVQIQSDSTCLSAMDPANGYTPGFDSTTMTCAGDPPDFGVDSCNGDSGGPLLVNGDEAGITDWGAADCGASGTYGVYEMLSYYNSDITTAMSQPSIINLDFTGDGHAGLMAIDGSGNLWYYAGSGFLNDGYNGFAAVNEIGSGWSGFKQVFRVTNWNDDDTESIMAVASNGDLYEWPTDGDGDFLNNGAATLIGTGWNEFSSIMVTNNWTGDGHADLLGRTPNGNLYLYETNGSGGWENNGIGQLVGTGWNEFNTILTPGDWTGNGDQALIGRTPNGNLYLYESNESGGWENNGIGQLIGTGWNKFSTFLSPGDWNGDGLLDMIGITPSGAMDLYETDGQGSWLNNGTGIQIGTGWNIFSTVF